MLPVEQLKILAASEEFQKILSQDPELEALEAEKYDPHKEYGALADVFFFHTDFYGISVPPLTPALWAYLWATRCPARHRHFSVSSCERLAEFGENARASRGCGSRILRKMETGLRKGS